MAIVAFGIALGLQGGAPDTLLDWTAWEQCGVTVKHPSVTIKPADIERAKANIRQHAWAKRYVADVEEKAKRHLDRLKPEFLASMIPETTPGDPLWTPCPSCRAQGKPVHPHGLWTWELEDAERIRCTMCGKFFPNDEFPEDVVLRTRWRKPQTISFCGGETFVIFGYTTGRPSFTANVRARKVKWMADYCHSLAEAFLLTGKLEYARACRAILLRFAECYPAWLVHVGYGEYADMDPRVASLNINNLPEPELCPPPNQPDHRLHTGYWSAGRAGGVGMESGFVRQVVEAYDWTCAAQGAAGEPIYSAADRRQIERDLLLESTILLVCDKRINNKSVSNRTAAGLVGMCVGHPELVRFGLEGFQKTISGWFLSDGTTSESPTYGLMTLGGIWDFAQAMRSYRDPAGYHNATGQRIDLLDLYHGTAYERVWDGFFRGMQGDLSHPPYADSFPKYGLGENFLELMVSNYPERRQYLALLRETVGSSNAMASDARSDVARRELLKELPAAGQALYIREPDLARRRSPALSFSDWCPPELRIGHLRTGGDGRESLLTLSASHWGIHHHYDSLNLYYWKQGHELLSDLGYLWDHPLKHMAMRTVAHNTVVVDEKDQVTKERGGTVIFFRSSKHVKAMEASSRAYPQTKLYQRTVAVIDHGKGRNYAVDFFRVQGGRRQDYVYHGSTSACDVLDLNPRPVSSEKLYDFVNIRAADGNGVWRAKWKCTTNMTCVAWNVGQPGEHARVADGWGQRDWKNSDIGATIPYIVRRCEGDSARTFISVFEGYEGGEPFVRNVKLISPSGVLLVETALGRDYIMSMLDTGTMQVPTSAGQKRVAAHFAAVSVQHGKLAWKFTEKTKPFSDRQ
jgi:hypothetical protein